MASYRTALAAPHSARQLPNGTVISSGLVGTLTQWTGTPGAARIFRMPAEEDTNPAFQAALEEVGMREQETLHLVVARTPGLGAFRTPAASDTIAITPAPPPEGAGAVQVILYQDESGGLSWHFPDGFSTGPVDSGEEAAVPRLRSAVSPRFTIAGRTNAARAALAGGRSPAHLRGPITKIGRKIFKVLVVPLSALAAGPLEAIVGRIERKHRQDLIRAVTPDNYRQRVTNPFADWSSLKGRRALLIVHGILSTTHGMLSLCPRAQMEKLHAAYGGRVIALDQRTLTSSPEDNARFLLEHARAALPDGRIDFDVLCHSRGGVVSRTLVERGAALVPEHPCRFHRVYFVAAPNAGSPLGDAEHMIDMIDVFTNLATNFPDGPVTYSIEVLLSLVKLVAYTALSRLPGVVTMGTRGYISDTLNSAPGVSPAAYAASAADYEPNAGSDNGFLLGRVLDPAVDRVFARDGRPVPNDLVVPSVGVWAANGHPSFPIVDRVVYGADEGVWHTAFFAQRRTLDHINQFLGIDARLATTAGAARPDSAGAAPPAAAENPALARPPMTGAGAGEGSGEGGAGAEEGSGEGAPGGPTPVRGPERPAYRRFRTPPKKPEPTPHAPGYLLREPLEEMPPGVAAPAVARREPCIDFHEAVGEGVTNELVVRLEDLTGGTAADISRLLEIPLDLEVSGERPVPLQVLIRAPGFEVEAPADPRMFVGRERNAEAEKLVFRLTARHLGEQPVTREIRAEFWLHQGCVGSVLHRTVVIPKNFTGIVEADGSGESRAVVIPAVPRENCDLMLIVEGEDETGRPPFALRLQCGVPGHEYGAKFVGKLDIAGENVSLGAYIQQVIEQQFARMPDPLGMLPEDFDRAFAAWQGGFNFQLDALGKRLWDWLPDRFRNEYFRLRDLGVPIRSILINSDEMLVPWELIIPYRVVGARIDQLPPLGQAHILGRWKPGLSMKPQPQRFTVRNFSILAPEYPGKLALPDAAREALELLRMFPGATRIAPSDAAQVQRLLAEGNNVHMLHISCHGEYDAQNADLSALLLEQNGLLQAIHLRGTALAVAGSPFVYLNACSVGAVGRVAGRMGGFAANVLESGFSGMIAPYWPVDDRHAREFSLALYQKLLDNFAVGEALQELRAERPDDLTFRAFALFGDPWTRLNFDPVLGSTAQVPDPALP